MREGVILFLWFIVLPVGLSALCGAAQRRLAAGPEGRRRTVLLPLLPAATGIAAVLLLLRTLSELGWAELGAWGWLLLVPGIGLAALLVLLSRTFFEHGFGVLLWGGCTIWALAAFLSTLIGWALSRPRGKEPK